jgi:hypothetical protein
MASTTCKDCGRVVWVRDVDGKGLCCFCQAPAPPKQDDPSTPFFRKAGAKKETEER